MKFIFSLYYRKSFLYRLFCGSLLFFGMVGCLGIYSLWPYFRLPVGLVGDPDKQIEVEVSIEKIQRKMENEAIKEAKIALRNQVIEQFIQDLRAKKPTLQSAEIDEEIYKNQKEIDEAIQQKLEVEIQKRVQEKIKDKFIRSFQKGTHVYRFENELKLAGYIAKEAHREKNKIVYTLQILEPTKPETSTRTLYDEAPFEFMVSSPSVLSALQNLFSQNENEVRKNWKKLQTSVDYNLGLLCNNLIEACKREGVILSISQAEFQTVLLETARESMDWRKVGQEIGHYEKTRDLQNLFQERFSLGSVMKAFGKGLIRWTPRETAKKDAERQLQEIVTQNLNPILSNVWAIGKKGGSSAYQEMEKNWLLLQERDFHNLEGFMQNLKKGTTPLSVYLRRKLLLPNDRDISTWNEKQILDRLNQLLREPLYSDMMKLVTDISEETKNFYEENPKPEGNDVFRLQRLLLQDAYPELKRLAVVERMSRFFSLADNEVVKKYIMKQVKSQDEKEKEYAWRKVQKIFQNPPEKLIQPFLKIQDEIRNFVGGWLEIVLLNQEKNDLNPMLLLALKESLAQKRVLVVCHLSFREIDLGKGKKTRWEGIYRE